MRSNFGFTGHSIPPHQPSQPHGSVQRKLEESQLKELDIVTSNIQRSLQEKQIKLVGHYGDPQFTQNRNNRGIIIEAPDLTLNHVGVEVRDKSGQYTNDIKPLLNDVPNKHYLLKRIERHRSLGSNSGIPWQHPWMNKAQRESAIEYILEEIVDTRKEKNPFHLNVTEAIESGYNTGHFGNLFDTESLHLQGDTAHSAKDAVKAIWESFSEGKLLKFFK